MKMQVVGLAGLGLVAALSASVLIGTAGARKQQVQESNEVSVIIAKAGLPAMSKIDASNVTTKMVAKAQAPAGSFTDEVQVVGQVLIVPVVEGQAFTKGCFAPEGSGFHLAANLQKGMRAISIAMVDYSGLDGLLYPGACVDVIASFDMRGKGYGEQGIVSTTMLQGVQVLAVDNRTVVSQGEEEAKKNSDRKKRVTILVDDKQAQMVQLAMQHGTVTLALRNPTDVNTAPDTKVTMLSELGVPGLGEEDETGDVVMAEAPAAPVVPEAPKADIKPEPKAAEPQPQPEVIAIAPPPPPPEWVVKLIKGGEVLSKAFPMPKPATNPEPQ
jgi:pilus assembly protein CpaB